MNAKPALVRPRFASDLDPQVALWIARLSTGFSAAVTQLNESMYSEELRQIIGIAPHEGTLSKTALKPLLRLRADELEQQLPRRKTVLTRNIEMLAALLEVDELQSEILTFAALSQNHPYLCELMDSIRTTSIDAITKLLSIALKTRDTDIRRAIRPDGQLRATRIVSIEHSDTGRGLQLVMPHGLRTAMFTTADNIQMLMSSFLENAPCPKLKADAFAHLTRETELLAAYLSKAGAKWRNRRQHPDLRTTGNGQDGVCALARLSSKQATLSSESDRCSGRRHQRP